MKQFKDGQDFKSFMEQLYVRGVEKMLEGEMDSLLGYQRYSAEGRNSGNSRNGKSSKKIKSEYGESSIEVPRDREGSFKPVIIPKRTGLAHGIEQLVVSLYAKGMSVRDIEEELREIYKLMYQNPPFPILRPK